MIPNDGKYSCVWEKLSEELDQRVLDGEDVGPVWRQVVPVR